jgi:hypothetical protein
VGSNPASDFQIMTWSLEWWPWSIAHGADPLRTPLLWAPAGFPTLWMTTVPAAALAALPVTVLVGPLFAYNLLMFVAVALAGGCAFLLCRELTGQTAPAVVGGLMFGLSPYMVGHTLSQHLNLTLAWPIPLLAWAILRCFRGRWGSSRSFVLVVAGLLVVQLGSSLELFVDLTLVITLAFAIGLAGAGDKRREVVRVGALVAAAFAVCLPLVGVVAYFALAGPHGALRHPPADYSLDLTNVVVPTPLSLFGAGHAVRSLSRDYVGNIGEQDGYLGIPVLVVGALALRARWREGAWFAACLAIVVFALSLGPFVTVRGRPYFTLPFATARVPLLANLLPARLSLFTMLLAACLCALWLSLGGRTWPRVAVATLLLVSLLPNFALRGRVAGAWVTSDVTRFSTVRPPVGFVDSSGWTRYVRRDETVLVLPTGDRTASMYWQVESGMRFRLAVPGTPFVPPELDASPTVVGLVEDSLPDLDGPALAAARLRAFLAAQQIRGVVVTPVATRWRRIVAAATRAVPRRLAGSLLYRTASHLPPLRATGERAEAAGLVAWLRYDGHRAHVEAALGAEAPMTLSAPSSDAEQTTTAVGGGGRAAVVFTEWHSGELLLRVATRRRGASWRVESLDRRTQPIWGPHVVITPGGTTVVAWLNEANPLRLLRVAVQTPQGRWKPPLTLDVANELASLHVAAPSSDSVLLEWRNRIANEVRFRIASYSSRGWRGPTTIASGRREFPRGGAD